MPNHVTNRLMIIAEQDRIQEVMERIKFDEYGLGSLDFEKIIPMPPELKVTSGSRSQKALEFYTLYVKHAHDSDQSTREKLMQEYQVDQAFMDFGKQLYENKQKHGAADWLDWSIENWGTKWNGYGYEDTPEREGGAEIVFKTAWSRPKPIIKALSQMFPDVQFRHQWADEDIGRNVGEVLYLDGEEIEYDIPNAFSKEAYEMAADIWDMPLSEWNLHYDEETGTYAYREREDFAIKQITTEELKRTTVGEGLILQGCGGDLADWVHGINKQLTLDGILQNGSEFTEYYAFEHEGLKNILFSMDNVDLDIGRLAAWRLQTRSTFGGYWLSDYLPNKFRVELGELSPEPEAEPIPEPEKTTEPYTLKAYVEHPDRPCDGGFSIPLPTKPEVMQVFLDKLGISDIQQVKIDEVYSMHNDDNSISHWLDVGLRATNNKHSLEELNFLVTKIAAMDEHQREMFGAAIQSGFCIDTIGNMINLTENLDKFDLAPAPNPEIYGSFLVTMHGENCAESIKKLETSADEYDRGLAQYIDRLEKCVDNAAFGKLIAKEENGRFTDYGYLRRCEEFENFKTVYRGIEDIPLEHRISKLSCKETLQFYQQKSRDQFGDPAPPTKVNENEEPSL